jgi:hypothetical protein
MHGEQSLWSENAYGDIWQEPQLGDLPLAAQTELQPPATAGTDEEETPDGNR